MTSLLRRKRPITPRNTGRNSTRVSLAAIAVLCTLLAWQFATHGRAFATDSSSDGLSTNHENKLRWLPFRPDRIEAEKTANGKGTQCSSTAQCDGTTYKSGECKHADCKQADGQCSGSTVHRVQMTSASGEMSKPRSQVRLASVEDDNSQPVLTDPFEDNPAPSTYQRQISITPEDVESTSASREPAPLHSVRGTKQAPAELQSSDSYTSAHELPGRSVKVYQPKPPAPGPGPDSYQGGVGDGAADLDAQRRLLQDPAEDCRAAYDKLHGYTLDKVSLDIKVTGKPGDDVPYECALTTDQFVPRCWQMTTYTWKASALCHKPLYFEEEALERYGHSHGWICEDLVSCAHFFGNVALLPYHVGVETPCECIYDLGVYRVGDCAPYICDPFPISLRGCCTAAVGYGAVVALFP